MDQSELGDEEKLRLYFILEMLQDAWAGAEGDHKARLSRIAEQVQAMTEGKWSLPETPELRVQIDNVVYPKFGGDQDPPK